MSDATPKKIMIKKYANRRLYHTGTSSYVTLEDLSDMVHKGEDFAVNDAKTGEDLTRSVLTQIIFDQENKAGQDTNLLPATFLRQLIRFYGDSMQSLVPKYLEFSIDRLTTDQQKFRDHLTTSFGVANSLNPMSLNPLAPATNSLKIMEDQARANMAAFTDALRLFSPFSGTKTVETEAPKTDLDSVRQQLSDLQAQINKLDKK